MVVIFRLKRSFFLYKFLLTITIIVIVLMISFRIIELLYSVLYESGSMNCTNHEPIDVIYTWVNGSDPKFLENLNTFLNGKNGSFDTSRQRFDDKYELKFSLRSLEKFAPWINHVYIVTNGQIPYWLNLDYEKVSIVTHEEIFKNTFNLPTFSSPAIEYNLHRISGLSNRAIYFNDDIFLAAPTYLEDFYSNNKGLLLYLAWHVPNCSPNCPWMYVSDGQCDKDCFIPECQMDGGDCDNTDKKKVNHETWAGSLENFQDENETKNRILADTVRRVRANFYNSFIKKLLPPKNLTEHSMNSSLGFTFMEPTRKSNFLFNVFSVSDMHNLTNFVNEHNRKVLRNDKFDRMKRRKRKYTKKTHKFMSQRINIDAYSASLQYTNRMLNTKYGFSVRNVPSHVPILIDRDIMSNLQLAFAKEFAITERNKVRRKDDVQFSFSYYYFIISEKIRRSIEDIFDEFDTDSSSTWSDREIRTLLTKLYELPLSYAIVDDFEALLLNCSLKVDVGGLSAPPFERYIDSKLPTITKSVVINCPSIRDILLRHFGMIRKYRYEIVSNSESKYVSFKMLNSNISDVVSNLDDIRSNRKKFVCLNDNLDESKESENELVRAILYDFYLSLFPHPSKFELPDDFRNKFVYVKDLNEWKTYRSRVKVFIYSLIFVTLCLIIYNVCRKKCCLIANKLFC